jgi:hypothetical protein
MHRECPAWVEERVLRFMNQAGTWQKLIDNMRELGSDPGARSHDHLIGQKVAARILETRNLLPGMAFSTLGQLRDIRGLGEDKYRAILKAFSRPSASVLTDALAQAKLPGQSRAHLYPLTTYPSDEASYQELITTPYALKEWVTTHLLAYAGRRGHGALVCKMLDQSIQQAFVEGSDNSDSGAALALALWLYQFQADDCFPFPAALEACTRYIGPAAGEGPFMRLWLIKPLDQGLLFAGGGPAAWPVAGHDGERSVTVWLGGMEGGS